MDLDDMLPEIGAFGAYQKWVYFLLCIPATLPSVFTLFNSIFVSATPRHWCHVPQLEPLRGIFPAEQLADLSIPRKDDGSLHGCRMYDRNYTALALDALAAGALPRSSDSSWPTKPCDHGWEFDTTYYDDTLVTQMNVVCDDAWKVSMAQCSFYIGSVVGNLVFGFIGDRFGRKKAFLLIIVVNVVGGIGAAFPGTYEGYIAWRGIVGTVYPAIFQTPFIMCMEIMSPEKRTFGGMFVCAVYGVALMSLAGLAYLLRSWFTVSLATSLPFASLLAVWWLIPESPRWLLSQNRIAEAEVLVQKIAKRNGKKIPANFLESFIDEKRSLACDESKTSEQTSFRNLVQYPNILKKVMVVSFSWTANTMVYNGLSFAVSSMAISEYVSFTISGAVEVPGVCLAWFFMDRKGRRPVMVFSMLLGGLACIATIFAPPGSTWLTVALCSLGKLSITASFATIYVYSAELFPTVLRNFAMGVAAMTASISLIITPHILYLGQLYGVVIPSSIFGALSAAGGVVILLLPETMNVRLPQTLSEGEAFGKSTRLCSCYGNRVEDEDIGMTKQEKQHQERLKL